MELCQFRSSRINADLRKLVAYDAPIAFDQAKHAVSGMSRLLPRRSGFICCLNACRSRSRCTMVLKDLCCKDREQHKVVGCSS